MCDGHDECNNEILDFDCKKRILRLMHGVDMLDASYGLTDPVYTHVYKRPVRCPGFGLPRFPPPHVNRGRLGAYVDACAQWF
jgi:hypothetical protein